MRDAESAAGVAPGDLATTTKPHLAHRIQVQVKGHDGKKVMAITTS
jgi:hypothetical protein